MSTLSSAKGLLKGSERESVINWRAVVGVAIGIVAVYFFGKMLLGGGSELPFGLSQARQMPEATLQPVLPTQYVVAMATEDPTATAWPTPIIITQDRVVEVPIEVTREVAYYVPGPEIEVTRVFTVEITPAPLPTITPIPLAPGTIQVCASVEGAKSLYIGNVGVVSGGCQIYTFGVGQTTILVQVNR